MKTKKRFNKLTAWLLTLAMLMTFMPSIALSASAETNYNTYEQMLDYITSENNYGLGDIPENRIFHAWGWSYQNIKENLENIAKQGFSTILVSPPNEISMPTTGVSFQDGWQRMYQPAGFQINESSNNVLGTKYDFVELCNAAPVLGLEIMVEAVVGYAGTNDNGNNVSEDPMDHVHPRTSEFEPELLAAKAFHDPWVNSEFKSYEGGFDDYEIEESLTQHAIDGKPDLATETQPVQDAIYDYFVELVEAGADGFYFNDAKYIETSYDTNFPSDFWEDTFVKLRENYPAENLQAIAEMVDGPGDGRSTEGYLQSGMNLTHTAMSDAIRESVINKTEPTADFDEAFPQGKSVLWSESYKTYANGETSALTPEQREKIWALTVSRKGGKGIYLARPSNERAVGKDAVNTVLSNVTLGEANVTDWGSVVVQRVNHFASFFEDEDENVRYDDGVAVIERGICGAVLVNMKGTTKTVNLKENTLAVGRYTDAITGETFIVEEGKITGTIGSTGIAVLYYSQDTEPITPTPYDLWVGGEQFTSANLTIEDENGGTATYDPDENTLTLNNYTYEGEGYGWSIEPFTCGAAIYYGSRDTLYLVVDGTNSVTRTGSASDYISVGVYADGSITVSGEGSLTATGGEAEYNYGVYTNGIITVEGGSLTGICGVATYESDGVFAVGSITVKGGSLRGESGEAEYSYGMTALDSINVLGGSLTGIGGEADYSYGVATNGSITVSGGEVVAEGNMQAFESAPTIADEFTNAVVWYGENEDAAIAAGAKNISDLAANYNKKYVRIAEDPNVIKYTVIIDNEITNGTVTANMTTASEGDTVTLTVTPGEGYELDMLTVKGTDGDIPITSVDDSTYKFIMPAGNVTVTATFKAASIKYDLWVGGERVTSDNADDVFKDDKVSYDPDENILTLNGYTYEGTGYTGDNGTSAAICYSGTDTLTLVLRGTNSVIHTGNGYDYSYGVYAKGSIIVDGEGSLTVTGGEAEYSFGVSANGSITVEGGSLHGKSSESVYSYGVFATVGITIKGGSLTGTGSEADYISCGVQTNDSITIEGGSLTATGREAYSSYGVIAIGSITVEGDGSLIGIGGSAEMMGTGVYIEGGSLTMNGGSVTGTGGSVSGTETYPGMSIGIAAMDAVSIGGGTTVAQGKTQAFSNEPEISDSFTDAMVWYGDDKDAAYTAGAQEKSAITDNYDQKYVRIGVPFYTITFNANGGSVEPETMETVDGKLESLPTPTRSGYNFKGWYDAETDGNKITTDTVFTKDTTVYAQWSKKSSGGVGGGSSNTTTTTTKNEDGSTTKTTENKLTGTKTEVTTNTDGSTTTVETKKDGTVTTTEKDKDGNTTTTVENPDGTSTTTEKNKDGSEKVTEEKADGTTVTTEKDTDGTKTVTTENPDGSKTTEETKKDGSKVTTETTADGETTAEVEAKGETEVVIPVPDADEVTKVIVTDKDGKETEITDFEITEGGVKITVSGDCTAVINKVAKKEFVDVHPVGHWATADVDYAYINGLMNGVSETHFAPNDNLTRAMLVTVLYRLEGEPATNRSIPFADVDMGAYYGNAVSWAKQNGIVNGVSETKFAPNDNITREQIAAIMHRYAKFKGYDVSVGENTNILSYDDFDSISEYAIAAMQYACGSGLMKGKSESTLNPLDDATRAEIAAILHRFIEANK